MRGLWCTTTSSAIILLSLILSSCNYNQLKKSKNQAGNIPLETNSVITAELVMNYSLHSCKNCHSKYADVNGVRAKLDKVLSYVEDDSMPELDKGDKLLDACQKSILRKWVSLGGPDTSDIKTRDLAECVSGSDENETPPVVIPPTEEPPVIAPPTEPPPVILPPADPGAIFITSDLVMKGALQSCGDCHNAYKTAAGVKKRIAKVMIEIENDTMPDLTEGAMPLTLCQKAILRKWVELGTPDTSTIATRDLMECAN